MEDKDYSIFMQRTTSKNVPFILDDENYYIKRNSLYVGGQKIIEFYNKQRFFLEAMEDLNIDWRRLVPKKMLQDSCAYLIGEQKLIIVDYKYLTMLGDVREKIESISDKQKIYRRIFYSKRFKVKYVLLLDQYYKSSEKTLSLLTKYKIEYYFEKVSLKKLKIDNMHKRKR